MSDNLNADAPPDAVHISDALSYEHEDGPDALRVSVALTTFNGARYLREQLDSLAAQTKLPFELVIGDDGSTDETPAIIEDFAATAPFPVHYHRNAAQLRFQANFVETARRCTGDLIAFCDQDDVWHKDKIARCVAPFADPDVMMVCHDANLIDANGGPIGKTLIGDEIRSWAPSRKPLHLQYGLTMVYRRCLNDHYDLWLRSTDENSPGLKYRSAHDQWFYFLAIVLGEVVNIDACLVDYRQHDAQLIGAFTHKLDLTAAERSQYYSNRARTLQDRVAFLQQLRERANPKYRAEIDARVRDYRQSLKIYLGRVAAYGAPTVYRRMSGVISTTLAGGYGKTQFGLRGLAADLLFGVAHVTLGKRADTLYAKIAR